MPIDRHDALLKEYGEVSSAFRMLTDIRFRLLALLPIGAAAAAVILNRSGAGMPTLALDMFGLVVTFGLATYNTRNDQLYDTLIARAAAIERLVGLPDGAFANRPRPWLSLFDGAWGVDHRTAISTIYTASSALWLLGILDNGSVNAYVLLRATPPGWLHLAALAAAIVLTAIGAALVREQTKSAGAKLRRIAVVAVRAAVGRTPEDLADDALFRNWCAVLGGIDDRRVTTRMTFLSRLVPGAGGHYVAQGSGHWTAAQTVALITDLAPEWLYDCATGRRLPTGAAVGHAGSDS
jgi:hypothetical protein